MTLNLQLPTQSDILKPTITVIGVGGAGGNAVNNMISSNLEGVNFVVANTDAQALDRSLASRCIQLGSHITRGLGAGANPEVGRAAAEEAGEEITSSIEGSNMLFITAGMGGGTGTGAAPVVARLAREQGILTVAVVTKPFQFEGTHRMRQAEAGLKELQEYVDTLIIIPNQNLFRIANERTTFSDAFRLADEVLHSGVRGVTDLIVKTGLINLDFADIRSVMREMGKAMMGTGEASGDRRAVEAAEAAISNPLLDDVSLKGARSALINITGGPDMTLFEVDEAANRIREEMDPEANIIFGSAFHETMEGRIRFSVIATGIDQAPSAAQRDHSQQQRSSINPIEQKKPYLFTMNRADAPKPAPARPLPAAEMERPTPIARPAAPEPKFTSTPVRVDAAHTVAPVVAAPAAPAAIAPTPISQPVKTYEPLATATPSLPLEAPPLVAKTEQRVEHVSMPEPEYAAVPLSPRRENREYASAEEPSARSLFARIAEVSRSLTPRGSEAVARVEAQPERQLQVTEKPRPELIKKTAVAPEEEQFLDIPAFLRRQAN